MSDVHSWLLDESEPSVRYRTLRDLLCRPSGDRELRAAREAVAVSAAVRTVFARMHPEGYWLQRDSAGRLIGEGVEYTSTATTHYALAQLAEFGLDRDDPRVALAADRYLDQVTPEGDFWQHMSCLSGINIRTFVMLGYGDDPRLRRAIGLLLATERPDGGYLCDLHEGKRKRRPSASCARGSAKALLAFAALPEAREASRCRALVDYFLRRDGVFRTGDRGTPVVREATQTVFPFTWTCSLLDVLLGLAALGFGDRPELVRAWALLEDKRGADGCYRLDWAPQRTLLRPGKRGEPSRWITFYALLAHKLRDGK